MATFNLKNGIINLAVCTAVFGAVNFASACDKFGGGYGGGFGGGSHFRQSYGHAPVHTGYVTPVFKGYHAAPVHTPYVPPQVHAPKYVPTPYTVPKFATPAYTPVAKYVPPVRGY